MTSEDPTVPAAPAATGRVRGRVGRGAGVAAPGR